MCHCSDLLTPAALDALRERKDTLNAWVSELVDSYEQLPLLLQFEVLDFLEIDEDFLEVAGEEDKDGAGAGGDGTGSAGTSGSGTQQGSGEDEAGVRGEAKNAREVTEKESSGSGLRWRCRTQRARWAMAVIANRALRT